MTGLNIAALPVPLKLALTAFLLTSSVGYFFGVFFVDHTTDTRPAGIEERFRGSESMGKNLESFAEGEEIQYEKTKTELLNIIHTHILGLSVLFLTVCVIFYFSNVFPAWLRGALLVEPFLSLIVTFGGIWLLRFHSPFWSYVIAVSGVLMTISFALMVLGSFYAMWLKRPA